MGEGFYFMISVISSRNQISAIGEMKQDVLLSHVGSQTEKCQF